MGEQNRDVVVVGASAGGVEALRQLVSALPADFGGCLLVVLHVPSSGSALPMILQRSCRIPVRHAAEGDPLTPGRVLVAPPDRHLIVYDNAVTLSHGPKENGHRPAVDVLFRSAARSLGSRVVGVVLSGALDDGAAGMVAIKLRGGVTVIQDPQEALHASMPLAAAKVAQIDHTLSATGIATLLASLVTEAAPDPPAASGLMDTETRMADLDLDALTDPERPGLPSGWSCPDCHGALFEIREGGLERFRCRIGHAYSPESLAAQQDSALETALWVALRALEEKASLGVDLGRRARDRGHLLTGQQFDSSADGARESAVVLRRLIDRIAGSAAPGPEDQTGEDVAQQDEVLRPPLGK